MSPRGWSWTLGRIACVAAVLVSMHAPRGARAAASAATSWTVGARATSSAMTAAPADTSLDQFLGHLSDSTSTYFGVAASKVDTAGLDSALTYGLAHPLRREPPLRPKLSPGFSFNRVDGPTYTLGARTGIRRGLGELFAQVAWATGPHDVLWWSRYAKSWGVSGRRWDVELRGGRETASMDLDFNQSTFNEMRAFLVGDDGNHYLRRDGFGVRLRRELLYGSLNTGYRDMQESPLATTTSWNLLHRPLTHFGNLAATEGRFRELEVGGTIDVHVIPIVAQVDSRISGYWIGSDFEYQRTRAAITGNFGLGRWATLLPQAVFGRLSGYRLPQVSYYLGGDQSLRSLAQATRGGSGLALGRFEVLGTGDALKALRIPHPAFLPIQLGAFAASGAVWGTDPFGGDRGDHVEFQGFGRVLYRSSPRPEDWLSEVGVSAVYQPGFPDPTSVLRFNYAWPLGPVEHSGRFSISFSRALDFLSNPDR